MKRNKVEGRVCQILDQVNARQRIEDDRVELKSNWIDVKKAARRIAGHANASQGEPILWIIGVDEETGVTQIEPKEFSNWYQQVKAEFDEGVVPNLLVHVNVPVEQLTVVALCFATDRAPYVVKNPGG